MSQCLRKMNKKHPVGDWALSSLKVARLATVQGMIDLAIDWSKA